MNAIIRLLFILTITLSQNLFACTLFCINQDEALTLVGNNCDSIDHAYEYYYIEPGEEGKYGAIYFGSDKDKQSAINERGLFYANAAIPSWPLEKYPVKKVFGGEDIRKKLMQECSTVGEAVQILKKYKTGMFAFVHMLLADRTGRSVLVEWNGSELKFIEKKGNFQIATNFYIFPIEDESLISCKRYKNAKNLLVSHDASIEICRSVLAATHQDLTQYSLIGNLRLGLVYLFVGNDYKEATLMNVSDELKKEPSIIKLSDVSSDGKRKHIYIF